MTDDPVRRSGFFPWASKTALLNSTIKYWEQNIVQNRPVFKPEPNRRVLSNAEDVWAEDQRWTDVVYKHFQDNMDDRQRGQQEAIWEIIHTEKRYIERLEILQNFWRTALEEVQRRHDFVITGDDVAKIFGGLSDVYTAQVHLWNRCFDTILSQAKSTGLPLNPGLLEKGFANMKKSFAPYLEYCSQYHNSDNHLKSLISGNEYLGTVLEWCKNQPQSERQSLNNWLFLPVKRIMNYSLLLSAILKKTDDDHHRIILHRLISKVDQFVKTINHKTWETQEQEKLDAVCDRIIMYDIFVSPSEEISEVLKGYVSTNFLNSLPKPGSRRLFLRELKNVKVENLDDTGKMIGTHLMLFSDIMLVCRPIRINGVRRLKITRPVIHLSRLHIHRLRKPGSCLLVITDPSLGIAQDGFVLSSTGKPDVVNNFVDDAEKAKAASVAGATVLLDTVSDTVIAGSTSEDFLDDDETEEPFTAENMVMQNVDKGKSLITATDKNSDPNLRLMFDNQNLPSPNPSQLEGSVQDILSVMEIQETGDPEQENKPPHPKLTKLRSITLDAGLLSPPPEGATPIKFQSQEDVSLNSMPISPALARFSSRRNSQDNDPPRTFFDRLRGRHPSDFKVKTDLPQPIDLPKEVSSSLVKKDSVYITRKSAVRYKKKIHRKHKTLDLNDPPKDPPVFYRRLSLQVTPPPTSAVKGDCTSPESSGNVSRNESISKRPDEDDRPLSQNSSGVGTLSRPTTPDSASPIPETEEATDCIPSPEISPLPSPSALSDASERQTMFLGSTERQTMFLEDATVTESSSDQLNCPPTFEYTLQIPMIQVHSPKESMEIPIVEESTDDVDEANDIEDDSLSSGHVILDKGRISLSDEWDQVTRV